MKRSRQINIDHMRQYASQRVRVRPLALAIAAATLVGCSSREPAVIYEDVKECIATNPELETECRNAFQEAVAEAEKTAPKYDSLADCRAEFGANNCQPYQGPQGQSWFMPAMAGFLLGQALDGGHYRSAPLFTSYNRRSPFYGQWTTAGGSTYGSLTNRQTRVRSSAFKPKPAVTRTISRGGFGSTVAAKSNWGGSRGSRGGWGG